MAPVSRRDFLRMLRNVVIGGAAGSLGLWRYIDFETTWFDVRHHAIRLPGLPGSLSGLKLAHLSDLHFNDSTTPEVLREVVDMVNLQAPDLIAITGDFIDRWSDLSLAPGHASQLGRLQARLGKFAVLGNHDHWEDSDLVRSMLAESGITELANRAERIEYGGDALFLCGLDDYRVEKHDLDALLADFPEDERGILLVHEPDYADISAATGRFSLQLSGHSHGGQVYLPLFGPPVTPKYGSKYPRGFYQINGMQLYTTTGIGMVPPYVRFNCRPEIAVFTLMPAEF